MKTNYSISTSGGPTPLSQANKRIAELEAQVAALTVSVAAWKRAAQWWRAEAISSSRRRLIIWLLRTESRFRRTARNIAALDDTGRLKQE